MLCIGRIPRRECNAFVFGTYYVLSSTLTISQLRSPFENEMFNCQRLKGDELVLQSTVSTLVPMGSESFQKPLPRNFVMK